MILMYGNTDDLFHIIILDIEKQQIENQLKEDYVKVHYKKYLV